MSDIKFGTDGWRGRIGDDYTYTNLRRATQGFAGYLNAIGKSGQTVIVGHDRRFSAEHFAASAAEVLAGNGLRVLLTPGPTPTPVISYSVTANNAVAAVNITASHNPPEDCGFKVRDENGGAVDSAGLKQIEEDCTGVSIRLMTSSDFVDLHDRHLVRLGESGGWAIPMFAALCGRQPVGSAVATRAAGFGVDYGAVWTRSIRPADRLRLLGNGTRH